MNSSDEPLSKVLSALLPRWRRSAMRCLEGYRREITDLVNLTCLDPGSRRRPMTAAVL